MDVSGNNDLASYIHVLYIILPSKVINKLLIKYLNNPNEQNLCASYARGLTGQQQLVTDRCDL